MYASRSKLIAILFTATFILSATSLALCYSEESSADSDLSDIDLVITYNGKEISLNADDKTTFQFYAYNTNANLRILYVTAEMDSSSITLTTNAEPISLYGSSGEYIAITINADKYAHQGYYVLTVYFEMFDPTTGTSSVQTGSYDFNVHVSSALTSDKYNKFLGIFSNELSGIFGEVWFTAIVSLIGLLAIGYCAMLIVVPVIARLLMKKDDPRVPVLKRLLYRLAQTIVWLWVIGQIARIIGMDEGWIDILNTLYYLIVVVAALIVAWQLYQIIVDTVIRRVVEKADDYNVTDTATDFESFRPLFIYIGEIVIAITGTMAIMNLLGFDLAAIITSAGLVSLGISMGAQDVLKQFFSGLEILATRPFKKGDLVKVGTDTTIYRIRRVNVMNTILENWDNTDVNIMPNSLITTNKIQNLTRETLICKVYVTVDVGYGTDVNLARKLIQDAACENPHVITDGSVGRPYTRLDKFLDSNLNIKLGFYVDDFNNQYSVSGQIRQSVIDKFDKNGISIDYEQVVVHTAAPETREDAEKKTSEGTEDTE